MTRIISGRLRGRPLAVPPSGTRPTTDRVREALFSAISSRVDLDGVSVLDLFAGSGALGLEAVSRGAEEAWFIEEGAGAVAVLKKNVAAVVSAAPSARITVRRASLPGALAGGCPISGGFDLVLADPPYQRSDEMSHPVLEALLSGSWLAEDALVVWERPKRDPAVRWPDGFEVAFDRIYGETAIEMARPVDTVTT